MERDSSVMNFFFCIPLMPKANASDWEQVSKVFNQTLRSLDNQTNKSFQVLLAAQDMPEIAPDLKLDVVHLTPHWTVENLTNAKLRDKRWKRTLLLRAVRERGGGYVMMLDADDLVSNRLVDYVLKDGDPNGYIAETGYAYDWKANLIAPIPGVWGKGFDGVCGSCSVINFTLNDLPPLRGGDEAADYLAKHLKEHSGWKHVMREFGRPLKPLPFPAAIYVLNHDNNLHFSIAQHRQASLPRRIEARKVPLTPALIKEFALPRPSS
ncbi:glycosyltransferase family A protein [Reyranella sp.]|uniref:glycosyltransferase family A protein n=1 Tax=Reyranella sp. TaxID=1929291 RepID=UPI003D118F1A